MESFFSTVKSELGEHFDSHGDAKMELFDYIEVFYTRISDFAVVPYPPDQSSRPEFAGLRREKPHHGG